MSAESRQHVRTDIPLPPITYWSERLYERRRHDDEFGPGLVVDMTGAGVFYAPYDEGWSPLNELPPDALRLVCDVAPSLHTGQRLRAAAFALLGVCDRGEDMPDVGPALGELRAALAAGDDTAPPHMERAALITSIDWALFGTEDGGRLDDQSQVPVGELRRLLREVWAAGPRAGGTAPDDAWRKWLQVVAGSGVAAAGAAADALGELDRLRSGAAALRAAGDEVAEVVTYIVDRLGPGVCPASVAGAAERGIQAAQRWRSAVEGDS